MEMASMRVGRSFVGIGGGSTRTTIVAFTIPLRPSPYRRKFLKMTPRETLLNQQLRWCASSGAVVASSVRKQWKRNRNQNQNHTEAQEETVENIGGVGQAVLAALKSEVPQPNNSSISRGTDERRSKEGEGGGAEPELSGSDVLLALQRASEAGRGKGSGKRQRNGRAGGGVRVVEDAMDYRNVRPLKINRDWGFRLDDLERRLQELLQL